MADEFRKNLVFLSQNISNLAEILVYLIQEDIISQDESDEINSEKTPQQRNVKLINIIQRKDEKTQFLKILRGTNNRSCADKIEGLPSSSSLCNRDLKYSRIIKQKWWPEKKPMIDSLYCRKYQNRDKSLVEELYDRISKSENKRRIVICESAAASKYSGMGGMGKTLTAKWYANEYENEYDHIIWIDCGEGSLQKSFESLARDLKVEHLDKLDLKQMTTKSFDELTEFKCLWIYDNAENYKGVDGIINVLPKSKENFSCIITSRSREWGTENIGFGKIEALELDIFSPQESLHFLKGFLSTKIERTDDLLQELSHSLGNLPLALQLAVATLNCGKIDLKSYIEKNKFEKVIDARFDDYERTINGNVKISLQLIMKEDGGKEAYEMLLVFAYIRPDDLEVDFFKKALGFEDEKVKAAIKILKKYSLVAKRKITVDNQIKIVLSIHRLLQQVIRHNGRETEEETLGKILGCEGFIDYKLLPFTKYANAKLKKEFPKVKAELLDQEQLKKLIREERFEESVRLAKFISEELKTNTSRFNYAICLDKNEQLEESIDVLEKLENEKMKEEGTYEYDYVQMGMLKLQIKVSRDYIYGQLLIFHWRLDNRNKMKEILGKTNLFQIINSSGSFGIMVRILHSDQIQSNYSLMVNRYSIITFKLGTDSKKIELRDCSLELSSFDRLSPMELTLEDVSFTRNGQKLEEVGANDFIDLDKINRLELWYYEKAIMYIDLGGDASLEYLNLRGVTVKGWKESKWNIQRLELNGIPFVKKTKMTTKEMEIYGSSLDISCLPRTIQNLEISQTKVVCNGEIDLPNLNYLTLKWMPNSSFLSSFHSANLTHVHFSGIVLVYVDLLPKSVTHIKITNHDTFVVGGVRRVNKLILKEFSFPKVKEFLDHLKTEELVVDNNYFSPTEFIELTKKETKKITVGKVKWGVFDYFIRFSYVDRKTKYYLWEGGRGRGIEKEEFEELTKLY